MNTARCSVCDKKMARNQYLASHPDTRHLFVQMASNAYCSTCYYRVKRGSTIKPTADLIEDIEWLLGTDSPEHIMRRVGYAPEQAATLVRRLQRNGRPDLAERFEGIAYEHKHRRMSVA